MNPVLEALITLNDLDVMIQETQNPSYREIGFKIEERLEELVKAREEIIKKIPREILNRYEKIKKRYGRGVAPVIGDVCLNCFIHLPVAFVSQSKRNKEVETCMNCGVYIYWG